MAEPATTNNAAALEPDIPDTDDGDDDTEEIEPD
jgi:hypothetical protein